MSDKEGRESAMRPRDKTMFLVLGMIGVLIVIMFVQVQFIAAKVNTLNTAVLTGNVVKEGNAAANTPPTAAQKQEAKVEVSADDDVVLGRADALVTIVEFSDYQCPFCGRFHEQTFPQVKAEYIDTGKVRFVFRDFPLGFHENAFPAAEAAFCAGEQGKYWDMNGKLFANQQSLSPENYKKWAGELGIDMTKFNACIVSGSAKAEIEKDMSDGKKYGVTGTPAFFVNGKLISGAQPFSAFKTAIDAELR